MKSMTGFGRASNRTSKKSSKASGREPHPQVELDISVKSVNGRYLEMRLHLPREYAGFEGDLKSIVGSQLSRGTVDVYINRSRPKGGAEAEVRVNTELAKKWLKGYQSLGSELKLKSEPTLELMTRIPDLIHVEERAEVGEAEKKQLKALLLEAVSSCDKERGREGKALSQELQGLCKKLESLAAQMEDLKTEANAELARRFRDRLQKLGLEGTIDQQRIAQEIIIQIDRADVSEEIARLREHLKAYLVLLKSDEPQGKKLDFYAQELLREVNTIGSKSHIAKLTSLVVDAKTIVEKIREQVQNVE